MRKPFQGVWNVIRFNWHYYSLAIGVIIFLLVLAHSLPESFEIYIWILCGLILVMSLLSLFATYLVYDRSGFYDLKWLQELNTEAKDSILNINAGFDETSLLLHEKFKDSKFIVFDFYDPSKHTEVSIMRARNAFPPYPNTRQVKTTELPLPDNSVDLVFVIFSAHEIRNQAERISFFKELNRILKPTGQVVVTEHTRGVANFLVYNIGFLHFHTKSSWLQTFRYANFRIHKELKCTPFVSTFILEKDGTVH